MNSIAYSYLDLTLIFPVVALMCLAFAVGYFYRWIKEPLRHSSATRENIDTEQTIKIGAMYELNLRGDPFCNKIIAIPLQVKNGFVQYRYLNMKITWSDDIRSFNKIFTLQNANKRNTTMPAKTKKKSKPEFIVDESFVGEPFDLRLLKKATVRTITKKTKLLDLSKKNLRLIRNALKPSAI